MAPPVYISSVEMLRLALTSPERTGEHIATIYEWYHQRGMLYLESISALFVTNSAALAIVVWNEGEAGFAAITWPLAFTGLCLAILVTLAFRQVRSIARLHRFYLRSLETAKALMGSV